MRGLFVTGTDTGVGKTVLSAALVAAMRAAGEEVRAYKPVLTGMDEAPEEPWPRDHELLAAVAEMDPGEVAPLRFGPAVSPHLAAELAGAPIDPQALAAGARRLVETDVRETSPMLVVEGVGGLLVPLAEGYLVRDLALALELPILIAARPGLGTINHTLLALEAARAIELTIAAVVLTPWAERPEPIEMSNLDTIAELGRVEVATLGELTGPEPSELAAAGASLPWRRWSGVRAARPRD